MLAAVFVGSFHVGPVLRDTYRSAFPEPEYTTGDFTDLLGASGTAVVMYATGDCPYCEKARVLLAGERVAYTERRIDESAAIEAEFIERGGRGVPLLYIGDRRIAGYREFVIREALDRIRSAEGVGLDLQRSPDVVAPVRR
jgi:glutaredoxin